MLNVIIIDDEPKAIQSLEWELNSFCKDVTVIATFTDPSEAQLYTSKNAAHVDCIFLDIEMPQMDGFRFLDFFPNRSFAVIITTAYDQYAIHALKERALDYLLKPIDSDDLIQAVERIRNFKKENSLKDRLEETLLRITSRHSGSPRKIGISYDGKIVFLDPNEILYCESDGNYCKIFLENGEKLFITQILKSIEDKLPEDTFYRVHNSYVVNLNKVREYQKTDGYLVLTNNKQIPVSRQKKSLFMDKL